MTNHENPLPPTRRRATGETTQAAASKPDARVGIVKQPTDQPSRKHPMHDDDTYDNQPEGSTPLARPNMLVQIAFERELDRLCGSYEPPCTDDYRTYWSRRAIDELIQADTRATDHDRLVLPGIHD
jgi:hypothetical protein